MKKLVLGAVAALLLIAPAAEAKAFRATVVKRNVATRTVVVATKAGTLRIVHNRRDRVGTVLRINGTHVKAVGHATRVHIKGVVTRRASRSFSLSAGGAVVKVRTRGAVAERPPPRPPAGQRAERDRQGLVEWHRHRDVEPREDDVDGAEMKGTLTCTPTSDPAVCDQPNTLKIDVGTAGAPILLPVVFDPVLFPDTMLGPLVGQQVEARTSLAPSAIDPGAVVLTLTNISAEDVCERRGRGTTTTAVPVTASPPAITVVTVAARTTTDDLQACGGRVPGVREPASPRSVCRVTRPASATVMVRWLPLRSP